MCRTILEIWSRLPKVIFLEKQNLIRFFGFCNDNEPKERKVWQMIFKTEKIIGQVLV